MFQFNLLDNYTVILLLSDFAALILLFVAGRFLKKQSETNIDLDVVRSFNKHVVAWIVVWFVLTLALISRELLIFVFFWIVSTWALA